MHGVSRIHTVDDVMLVTYSGVDALFMAKILNALADAGVVVDMISQTFPSDGQVNFSFTAAQTHLGTAIKVLGSEAHGSTAPMISGGYAKVNLFGQEMVESVGVAARALSALCAQGLAAVVVTTSDVDISLLLRQEDADVAARLLTETFQL